MTYNTGNAVPSTDPRDLDDNAQALDRFLMSTAASEPDRLGEQRKTWHQMEEDAEALVAPNVSALAAAVAAANKGVYFSGVGPVAMATYDLHPFVRGISGSVDQAAFRTAIGAMNLNDSGAYAGSASKFTTARSIAATGDAAWSVSFDGSANATAALTLAASGVTPGTYNQVTVDAKGRATAGVAKPAWTAYTPTITPKTGAFTSVTATGSYLVVAGLCFLRVKITVTTVGTGTKPQFTLPLPALTGTDGFSIPCIEGAANGKRGSAAILGGIAECADYNNGDLVTANGSVINVMGFYPIA